MLLCFGLRRSGVIPPLLCFIEGGLLIILRGFDRFGAVVGRHHAHAILLGFLIGRQSALRICELVAIFPGLRFDLVLAIFESLIEIGERTPGSQRLLGKPFEFLSADVVAIKAHLIFFIDIPRRGEFSGIGLRGGDVMQDLHIFSEPIFLGI